MTTWPVRGGPTEGHRSNSKVLHAACRIRDRSRRLAAALLVALTAGAGLALLSRRLDDAPPGHIHGRVRHATLFQPR